MINSYPRETVEFVPVTVKVGGVEVLTGVTIAVVPSGARPTQFDTPTTLAGKIGVMITDLTPGDYIVFAKVASSPESPVVDCGALRVT